jgi:D-lyxose ketol-isomerase
MQRSEINQAYRQALACFHHNGWALPPNPKWDITDFGLGNFPKHGLTLVNLAAEPEYCEKLMYACFGQTTPCHVHERKKEDIVCRSGELTLRLWPERPTQCPPDASFRVMQNGLPVTLKAGERVVLNAGSRITLIPGVWHEFFPTSQECIIGEVSTANDDLNDNHFLNPAVGRFPSLIEDEPATIRLVGE